MARSFNFSDFPVLEINSENVSGSWKSWLTEFQLSVEMVTMKLGKETVDEAEVNVFRGRMKLLALLHSIGKDGREILQYLGFDLQNANSTYEQAMEFLTGVYGNEENIYVKTMKFVTASQANSETECDYLLRVEKLSRNMNVGIIMS